MATKSGMEGDSTAKKSCPASCLNQGKIIEVYSPIVGATSYSLLSVNVLNPSLNFSFISKRDATNLLLAGSIFGTGCYLYSRPHLQQALGRSRLLYAGFGSVMFTFSSVLLWAILRSFLPNNVAVGSVAGLATSYALVKGGKSYLELVDSQIPKK